MRPRRTPSGRARLAAGAVVLALLVVACGSNPTPAPGVSGAPATPSPGATGGGGSADLRFAIDADPTSFAGAPDDAATQWITNLIDAGLYRIDDKLQPEPALAAAPPVVSADGRTWTITLRDGLRWSDGTPLTSADVKFSYDLLSASTCAQASSLCGDFQQNVASVTATDPRTVTIALRAPYAPFLALDLTAPILPRAAVTASLARYVAGAAGVKPAQVQAEAAKVLTGMADPSCGAVNQPGICAPSTYVAEVEPLLAAAGIALPDRARYADAQGNVDLDAYGQELISRLDALDLTLRSKGIEQVAAALDQLDFSRQPVGAGPYVLERYAPGKAVSLRRNPYYYRLPVGPARVEVSIIPDPAVATTALEQGDLDWLPELSPDAVSSVTASPDLTTSSSADLSYYAIAFNLRKGHLFADANLRKAFSMCIDHDATVAKATGGNGVPLAANVPPGSWWYDATVPGYAVDVAGAKRLIEASGWSIGADGIYEKGSQRLSAVLYLHRMRPAQLAFANLARDQLRRCGIEIVPQESDFQTTLLPLLRYPNTFDLYLGKWQTSVDPDAYDVFHSSQASSKANPDGGNIVGYGDPVADKLLVSGRQTTDPAARKAIYDALQQLIHADLPYYFLWSDGVHRGYSKRVSTQPPDTIDYSSPLDYWNQDAWVVGPR